MLVLKKLLMKTHYNGPHEIPKRLEFSIRAIFSSFLSPVLCVKVMAREEHLFLPPRLRDELRGIFLSCLNNQVFSFGGLFLGSIKHVLTVKLTAEITVILTDEMMI